MTSCFVPQVFLMLVTFTAMPVSTTHSIVGGTVGAAAVGVGFNCLNWDWESGGLSAIIASWVISPVFSGVIGVVAYWLTLTLHVDHRIVFLKDLWPLGALLGSLLLLCSPYDWMPEWQDASQRWALARTMRKALSAPFAAPSLAVSFVADVFTSMPKCFSDLSFAACIYATGEAFQVGEWQHSTRTFERSLVVCTSTDPTYKIINAMLSLLPFCIRWLQCARQVVRTAV